MNWTQERVERFRRDPINQLAQVHSWTFLFLMFCCGFFGAAAVFDVLEISGIHAREYWFYGKYVVGAVTAVGVLIGHRNLWNIVTRMRSRGEAEKGAGDAGVSGT